MQDSLMDGLQRLALRTINGAGPRYTPGVNPGAPNLLIEPLERAVDALAQNSHFMSRAGGISAQLDSTADHSAAFHAPGRKADRIFAPVAQALADVAAAPTVDERATASERVADLVQEMLNGLEAWETQIYEDMGQSPVASPSSEEDTKGRQELSAELYRINQTRRTLDDARVFATGNEGTLATKGTPVILAGEWGSGKTHFLCDFAARSLANDGPIAIVLASMLRSDLHPLDAIAELGSLASSGEELLARLDEAGRARGVRALIIIDAINEADRARWTVSLQKAIDDVARFPNVALVVSCRTPYDLYFAESLDGRSVVLLKHLGFEDREFEAQTAYFDYYRLPPLQVPPLSPEFKKPLFLKIVCEGVKNLGRRAQREKLRDLASGQKGMTYILEQFAKHVGKEVEKKHRLSPHTCWNLMKGAPRSGRPGFAGVLVQQGREWLTPGEVEREVQDLLSVDESTARVIRDSMQHAGLLVRHIRWRDDHYEDIYLLPYQRFSDHLVARHLLDAHLDAHQTATQIRRCFYAGTPLGRVFEIEKGDFYFREPGVAAALMVEFPERLRRLDPDDAPTRELYEYLPQSRRLLEPVATAFFEGLPWRPPSELDCASLHLVDVSLTNGGKELRSRAYEVLLQLALRPGHPLGSSWLLKRLAGLDMRNRDLQWSEYIRLRRDDSIIDKIIQWACEADHSRTPRDVAQEAILAVSCVLTTTDRRLRDQATNALVRLGQIHYDSLFAQLAAVLAVRDPYIQERYIAACYGVSMRLWALSAHGDEFANELRLAADGLAKLVLDPDGPFFTWHALTRSYSLGLVELAERVSMGSNRPSRLRTLERRYQQRKTPFRSTSDLDDAVVAEGESGIRMDFGNYTIGKLVPQRGNYDFEHSEYAVIRRQIACRMADLGYSRSSFGEIDTSIGQLTSFRRDGIRIDRYGKKYGWIAFFEMYGLRSAAGQLDGDFIQESVRSSDCDIDPSFPEDIPTWEPPLPDPFAGSPDDLCGWIRGGALPDYDTILTEQAVDGVTGPWSLVSAFVHRELPDGRAARIWVSSAFIARRFVDRARRLELARDYHVAEAIPEPDSDYYLFHGEVPWSPAYGAEGRRMKGPRRRFTGRALRTPAVDDGGVPVELPARSFGWEGYHSQLNQIGEVLLAAPPIARFLDLRVADGSSDMVDARGQVATLYRREPGSPFGSRYFYIRTDLVSRYMDTRGLCMLQSVVTDRTLSYAASSRAMTPELREALQTTDTYSGHVRSL